MGCRVSCVGGADSLALYLNAGCAFFNVGCAAVNVGCETFNVIRTFLNVTRTSLTPAYPPNNQHRRDSPLERGAPKGRGVLTLERGAPFRFNLP